MHKWIVYIYISIYILLYWNKYKPLVAWQTRHHVCCSNVETTLIIPENSLNLWSLLGKNMQVNIIHAANDFPPQRIWQKKMYFTWNRISDWGAVRSKAYIFKIILHNEGKRSGSASVHVGGFHIMSLHKHTRLAGRSNICEWNLKN